MTGMRAFLSADGLSQIVFALSAAPLTFERLTAGCGPQLAAMVLKFMESGSNSARKNAALFLSNSLHFPALLTAFDAQVPLVVPVHCSMLVSQDWFDASCCPIAVHQDTHLAG